MVEITIGYVAGFIAAAVFVVRLWIPTILTFILSGALQDKNTAATWNVAGRALQKSYWPMILSADTSRNHGVRTKVVIITSLITLMSIIVAIAGVITPLGLYEALVEADSANVAFQYVKDSSPFDYGTPPRSNLSFNRACFPSPCPFSDTIAIGTIYSSGNGSYDFPYGYNTSIPNFITEAYSSGTADDSTISNYFDIQWRRYVTTNDERYNNGSTYLIGAFRQMQSMVLNNDIEAVEGLIVDTINGGIGMRNHSVPPGFEHGAAWSEDLLFIEPETVCVDTNITIDYTVAPGQNFTTSIIDLVLTDHGGFVNANTTYPEANLTDTQANPDLWMRAYKAGWMTNAWTMFYYNITNPHDETTGRHAFSYLNSQLGKTFPLPIYEDEMTPYDSLAMDTSFYYHLNMLSGTGITNSSSPADSGPPTNPFDITSSNFTDISLICAGAGGQDFANITNIFVSCGLMRGIPQRKDNGSPLIFDSGSRWTQPLYSCATAVKATIKTVSLTYNGTDELKSLAVNSVKDKIYPSEEVKPLWGVENTDNTYTMASISLIWGLISSAWETNPKISTVRQESLYLPGYGVSTSAPLRVTSQNLPASDFYQTAVGGAYDVGDSSSADFDYSGENNMAMWVRWQNLSSSPETAALIPNSIFTDYAAAAVVGTKGVLGPGNAATLNLVDIRVIPTVARIRYHYAFAIPALIVVIGLLATTTVAILMLVFRRGVLGEMRRHLKQSATGRVLTTFLYPDMEVMDLTEKVWSEKFAKVEVDMRGDCPSLSGVRELERSGYRAGTAGLSGYNEYKHITIQQEKICAIVDEYRSSTAFKTDI
ncbi:uncharacterized protein LY89DRAFT_733185 [Mollisia scopiformis]|uniref:Uncharacterized protein n=1 Tax=Mollisia scopiformis TaxID=149040 RepID=A0A194XAY3_MOLSC|nr:uncharacterized protein LY89DRAFT_733185 [Mollisia scopiformis]KUJ17330.1 hypothetical protein LY89DRAFT_733185 [Mollisia scopiformis]